MSEENKGQVTFHSFDDALDYIFRERRKTQDEINRYREHVKELTGFYPEAKIGPMEILEIIRRVTKGNGDGASKTN